MKKKAVPTNIIDDKFYCFFKNWEWESPYNHSYLLRILTNNSYLKVQLRREDY